MLDKTSPNSARKDAFADAKATVVKMKTKEKIENKKKSGNTENSAGTGSSDNADNPESAKATLDSLKPGTDCIISEVGGADTPLRRHLLNMGLTPGTEITLIKIAPMGDPYEFRLRGYELTLRREDAAHITVRNIHTSHNHQKSYADRKRAVEHPGVGEHLGNYAAKGDGNVIPEGKPLSFGLAGNQNCGKTTLFNQLTGSNQHVGNFPGVTVDRKDGPIRKHLYAKVTDLPGVYSLSPYSGEELITRNFLLNEHPNAIINILDATNIERNLYLTLQLMELGIPMVLALNMMDEVRENGGTIMINSLEQALGVPVIPISASKNEGIDELIEHALHVARYNEKPGRCDFCDQNGEDHGAVHRCIHALIHLVEDHAKASGFPPRFAATKLVEGDETVISALGLDENEKELVEHILLQLEEESGKDRQAALADMRFSFIDKLCSATVVRPHKSREHERSRKIDKILTGKYTGLPAFVLIMATIFWLTFGVIGKFLSDLTELGIDALTNLTAKGLDLYGINPVVRSLIIDGIFTGVGSVLSFLPTIVVLFFFLSILEDTGYMARVAFIMDRLLRKIGLSGRSFVPMLIGFGCTVPAIMATRTLPSDRDRKMTVLLTPFMSCSAKIPVYAFFTAAFFPKYGGLVMTGLYFTGIFVAILMALLFKKTLFTGNPVPFVMELPNYRFPSAKSVFRLIYEKAKDFITKAFTIIFVASIIVWFLQSFDMKLNAVSDPSASLLALIGGAVAYIFMPLGFGDWKISTALLTGFSAKESVVSTLEVLGGSAGVLAGYSTFTILSILVFILLYTPCVAAIAAVRRELGGKWAVSVVILQCVVAWLAAFLVHCIGLLAGQG